MPLTEKTNILVIGGGIIGLSIAYSLTVASEKRIVIVERGRLASEASYGNAGEIAPALRDNAMIRRLGLRSLQLFKDLARSGKFDFDFQITGLMRAASSGAEYEELCGLAERRRREGFEMKALSAEEACDMEPALSKMIRGAIYSPDAAHGDSYRLACQLASFIRSRGVKIIEGVGVIGFGIRNNRIEYVRTSDRAFAPEFVVLAAGPWSADVARLANIKIPVTPAKGYMITTPKLPIQIKAAISYLDIVIIGTGDGRIRFGGTVEHIGFDPSISQEKVGRIKGWASEAIPALKNAPTEEVWTGLRPYTPDELPIIGWSGEIRNLLIATGHFRSGFMLAPLTGLLVSQLLEGRAEMPLDELSPSRFADKP